MDDDYEEPAWKKRSPFSYSRAHLLDGDKQKRVVVDFSDEDEPKVKRKVINRKKKEKPRLEDIFEQSFVYQNLQKIKDTPLNVKEVDYRGNVIKRYEYYFNYEEDKHDVVEVRVNDESTKRKAYNERPSKKEKILQNLNSSTVSSRTAQTASRFNRSSFDLSIIEKDKTLFANTSCSSRLATKLNRSLISEEIKNNEFSFNLSRLYTSFSETKNVTLSCFEQLSDQDKILKFCRPKTVSKFANVLDCKKQINKIAEGSFGEIYRLDANTILKVVKLEDDQLDQVLPEIIVSFTLNELQTKFHFNNFIRLRRCALVRDQYSSTLLNAWTDYNENVKRSENECPSNYDANSLYILLFLEDGGVDLESSTHLEPRVAISIFKQVVLALAIAERTLQFEHRDLHLGNILIKRTDERTLTYRLNDKRYRVETNGVRISIIDYSLTRFTKNGITIYQNLSECPHIFEGKGDIQYECYRKMKKLTNEWSAFCPATNVVWLDYLTQKLDGLCVARPTRLTIEEKKLVGELRRCRVRLKKYDSCFQAVELLDSL